MTTVEETADRFYLKWRQSPEYTSSETEVYNAAFSAWTTAHHEQPQRHFWLDVLADAEKYAKHRVTLFREDNES